MVKMTMRVQGMRRREERSMSALIFTLSFDSRAASLCTCSSNYVPII